MARSLLRVDTVAVEGKLYRHAAAVLLECVVVEKFVRQAMIAVHRLIAVVYMEVRVWALHIDYFLRTFQIN